MDYKIKKLSATEAYKKKVHEKLTPEQHLSEKVSNYYGSWKFIIIQSLIIAIWIIFNCIGFFPHFDDSSLSKLNLLLGIISASTGPLLQMSQNRQGTKDRWTFEHDYEINTKAEKEICELKNMVSQLVELHSNNKIQK